LALVLVPMFLLVAVPPSPVLIAANPAIPAQRVIPATKKAAPPAAPAAAAPVAFDDDGEAESHDVPPGPVEPGHRYTADISDATLEREWKDHPQALGSISVGFTDSGRLINGEQMPADPMWIVDTPSKCWGTHETVQDIETAVRAVRAQYPDAPQLNITQIGAKDGGWLLPHKSHQSGRDADIAFYYPTSQVIHVRAREHVIDVKLTWALLKAFVTRTDVQLILLDRHVQKVLYDYALAHGEDRAWLDSLFHAGYKSLVKHARHHRTHMHVRFYNPRAQELGVRVAPLLAEQPEYNVAIHRVRSGENLGRIAIDYGSSVRAIRKANHLKSNFIRAGWRLHVPVHGLCTHCPVPAPVVVPPRHLPPDMIHQAQREQPVDQKAGRSAAPHTEASAPVAG